MKYETLCINWTMLEFGSLYHCESFMGVNIVSGGLGVFDDGLFGNSFFSFRKPIRLMFHNARL